MADNAIGILFEVKGGGDINGQTGKRINGQLRNLVGQINKTDTLKLKFQIDSKHINDQIKELKKQLENLSGGSSDNKQSGSSGGKSASSEYANARKAMNDYYTAKARYERAQSRTTNVDDSLRQQWQQAESAFDSYFERTTVTIDGQSKEILKLKDSVKGLTEEQREAINSFASSKDLQSKIDSSNITANAQQAWSNLTAKVHDYINRVEYAASRDDEAARGLKELRELANSTDYRGYDELKKKLAEVQHHINKCDLATETWGQKMIKTFGSRVRSALAGIMVAKVGQYIRDVYNNVVDLDEAVVNLQIATGKTREETKLLVKEYAGLAKQLGATTNDIADSADTWLRQGYSEEQTDTLIKNSTMLSKLGKMDAESASKALTSAMNGYKVAVKDSISIVDKFTAVDMEAAASAGDIATAMAETATSADVAGVSMDKLIGYITVVKEVTQDGAESVGTFYKTLFARMNNVAAGKFVDDETGESLNDVETVLHKLGIDLRNANGEFRKSADVLDEVASRWSSFDNTAQHAIATAFAGTRQQEKFIVLMENYGDAIKYAQVATDSAGTSTEKFDAWLGGVDGKVNTLKASFEEFSMALLDSNLITGAVDVLTKVLNAITAIVDAIGGLNTVLYVTAGLILTIKLNSVINIITNILGVIPSLIAGIKTFSGTLKTAWGHGMTLGSTLSAAFDSIGISASAAQLAVGAFVAVLGISIAVFNKYRQSQEESIQSSVNSAQAYVEEAKSAKEDAESLDELIAKYQELAQKKDGAWSDEAGQAVKNIQEQIVDLVGDQASAVDLVNGKLDDQIEKLENIRDDMREISLEAAQAALSDSEVAIQSSMNKIRTGDKSSFDIGVGGGDYGNIKMKKTTKSAMGSGSYQADSIVTKFDTAKEFVDQYEAVLAYKNSIAGTLDETNKLEVEYYNELNEFLSEFKDVYTAYTSARDLVDELGAKRNNTPTTPTIGSNEDVIKQLKKEQEMYEQQLDRFEELIDIRKELLKTYQEEAEYQKELEKRQKNVANLQTKLEVAKLDTSAAGQARVRELEDELAEAQEELDDITLDHAIDVLTKQLDETNNEWQSIINKRLDEIASLLEDLNNGGSLGQTPNTDALLKLLGRSTSTTTGSAPATLNDPYRLPSNGKLYDFSTYHTGGFVGGEPALQSDEEFAKLMKSEFVSTPSQIQRFMKDTLPRLVGYSSSVKSNEFNAPLVEINCDSVTTESLPELKKVVNEAVKEIQRQLDSGMSRTGFKKQPIRRLF